MSIVLFTLLSLALVDTQLLLGGKELAYSLPGYGLLAVAAGFTWLSDRRRALPNGLVLNLATSAIFFGYVLIRALCSSDHYLARHDLFLVLAALIVYLLTALNLTLSKLRLSLVGVLLLLAFADTLIGISQYHTGESSMPIAFLPRHGYGWRASGFFSNPNHLAGFLEIVVMMGFSLALWSQWRPWGKILAGYISLVCVVGILLTGSRGGYISTIAGLIAFACLSLFAVSRQRRFPLGPYLVVATAGCLVLWWGISNLAPVGSPVHVRVASASALGANSNDCRPMIWHAALEQFRLNRVFGTGSGTFLYYGRQFRDPSLQTDPIYAHSDYLQLLAEYGLVGMVGFILFLSRHVWSGWRAFVYKASVHGELAGIGQGSSLALTLGALCATIAMGVHSFVDFNLHIPANALVMAFLFGVLANPGGKQQVNLKEPREVAFPWSPRLRLALPLLGIWLAVAALPTLPAEFYGERARALFSNWRYLESTEVAAKIERLARNGLRCDAGNTELYYDLGEAEFALATDSEEVAEAQSHHWEAITAYEKALEISPRDVRLLLCEVTSLDALHRYGESEVLLQRALELDPNSIQVLCSYANHLYAMQRYSESEMAYRKAQQFGSATAEYWLQVIAADRKAGKFGANSVSALVPIGNR